MFGPSHQKWIYFGQVPQICPCSNPWLPHDKPKALLLQLCLEQTCPTAFSNYILLSKQWNRKGSYHASYLNNPRVYTLRTCRCNTMRGSYLYERLHVCMCACMYRPICMCACMYICISTYLCMHNLQIVAVYKPVVSKALALAIPKTAIMDSLQKILSHPV